jgi:hypothetical protein
LQGKIIVIIFSYCLLISCSVFKTRKTDLLEESIRSTEKGKLNYVIDKNISFNNFFISNAKIQVIENEGVNEFLINVKHVFPEKYLISIRNKMGFEIVRIFVSSDTLLVNDRINRAVLYGGINKFEKKYGVKAFLIPVLFGDLIINKESFKSQEDCDKGLITIDLEIDQLMLKYVIDCEKSKVTDAFIKNVTNNNEYQIKYSGFIKEENYLFPQKIQINYKNKEMKLIIVIKKIEFSWNGNIDFVPGNKYEFIPIL